MRKLVTFETNRKITLVVSLRRLMGLRLINAVEMVEGGVHLHESETLPFLAAVQNEFRRRVSEGGTLKCWVLDYTPPPVKHPVAFPGWHENMNGTTQTVGNYALAVTQG